MNSTVLFVSTGLGIGGAETLLLEISRELQYRGFNVIVASLVSDNPLTVRFEDAGIEVVELGASPGRLPLSATLKLRKIIRKRNVTFVQGWMYHGNMVSFVASLLSGLSLKKQVGFGIFGVWPDMSSYGRATGLVAKIGGKLSRLVRTVIYNANSAARDHEERGYSTDNSLAIGNCVDTEKFRFSGKARKAIRKELGLNVRDVVAIIAARNHPQKDWPTMLNALSGVENLSVLAVGHGTQELPDHKRLMRLGPRNDMAALYSASDFFVLTSAFGEGTSLGLSEAMSCSLPIIVTDVGDNGLYIDGTGYSVGIGQVNELRQVAKTLSENEKLRKRLSQNSREMAMEAFSTSKNVEPLVEIYSGGLDVSSKQIGLKQ